MVEIQLPSGHKAQVDEQDRELVSRYTWRAFRTASKHLVYAVTGQHPDLVFMHRLIHPALPVFEIDHKDRDGLNNRRENLRVCLRKDNAKNRKQSAHSKQPYKGIERKQSGRWMARITVDGKRISLGTYDNPVIAARVYDKAAIKYHGDFASTNF